MAVEVRQSHRTAMSSGRRFAIGANVTLVILVAAALLVAVNWIATRKNYRRDLASLGNFGLSERTQRIIRECPEDIHLSILYRPNEKDEKQQAYIRRLLDYCDELQRFSSKVHVEHIATAAQRERLVARISKTFGGQAEGHRKALAAFDQLRADLDAGLEQRFKAGQDLLAAESTWLGSFPLFAQVVMKLRGERQDLEQTAKEIAELTPEGGIPKYADAVNKAKAAIGKLKTDCRAIAEIMGRFTGLADETARPDSEHIRMLGDVARQSKDAVDSLMQIVGKEGDPVPQDLSATLKAYADRGTEVGGLLDRLVRRVDRFAKQFPMVRQHANWTTQVQRGPFLTQIEVAGVLQDAGRGLRQTRLGLLGVLDRGDPDQLRQALRETRRNAGVLMQNATVIEQVLTGLADSLSNIDPQSKQLLDAAKGGAWLKDQIAAIEELEKELNDLPELKSGSVADEVKQDNTVFVEVGDRFRVVPFASVWPVRESIPGARSADETVGRTFNGDSSVSSAILALSADKPFASVVLVSFEPPAPRQQNPFMPKPPQSVIPSRGLSEVRRRLQSANFKVVDWNLATQKEKPPAEEGLDELFVILPPAPPSPPNPFGGGTPPDQLFNDQHRRRIRDLLDNDGRALFLASWEVVGAPFGGGFRTPPYGYAPLLEGDWGLRVDNALRVVYVEPDLTTGRGFTVGLPQFQHLPVNGFTDNPIGKPMRGTRFLVSDACRIEPTAKVPDGITTERVLTVPRNENYIGADVDEIIEIVEKVNAPESGGVVELKHRPRLGPFDLMVTAERREGDQRKGKIAVMSFGGSLTDRFLKQPVLADVQKVRFDPPPTENLDLFVNALYWLADKPAYIGRGPVPVPRVEAIDAQQQRLLRAFVWIIWPVAVFVPGLVLWYVRRR